jgi:hypothetical protein
MYYERCHWTFREEKIEKPPSVSGPMTALIVTPAQIQPERVWLKKIKQNPPA